MEKEKRGGKKYLKNEYLQKNRDLEIFREIFQGSFE